MFTVHIILVHYMRSNTYVYVLWLAESFPLAENKRALKSTVIDILFNSVRLRPYMIGINIRVFDGA